MSFLQLTDPANNLDIYTSYPDFDHSQTKIWSRDIPDYSIVKKEICVFDIETPPIKKVNGKIDFNHSDNLILSIRTRLNGVDKVFELEKSSIALNVQYDNEYQMLKEFIEYIQNPNTIIWILAGHNIF